MKVIIKFLLASCFLFFGLISCDSQSRAEKEFPKSIEDATTAIEKAVEEVEDDASEWEEYKPKTDAYDDYYEEETADGIYKHETSEGSFIISISGDAWRSEYMIVTGFGSAYDRQNAQYDSGIYYNGGLYDNSGYVQLGSASNGRVNFSGVTLYK